MSRLRVPMSCLAAGAVGFVALCSGSAMASFHGRNGRIAWTALSAGGGGGGGFESLTTFNAQGRHRRVIGSCTEDSNGNVCGNWENVTYSPDGKHMMWDQPVAGGVEGADTLREVILANADGTSPTVVSNVTAIDPQASFAPGGNRIVYVRESNSGGAFGTMITTDLSGGSARVVSSSITGMNPLFTPNGKQILFIRSSDEALCSIGVDGRNAHRVLAGVSTVDIPFDISPDGQQIAYVNHTGNLYVARANGTHRHRVAIMPDGSDPIDAVRFSPDGNFLVFAAQSAGTGTSVGETLYRIDTTGGPVHAISRTGDVRAVSAGLSWQPLP